jgi:F5/8 type C domain
MTSHDRLMGTQPTSHRAGGKRLRWRLPVARPSARRTWQAAIAVGIAAVTITVPPLIARRPIRGLSAPAAPTTRAPAPVAAATSALPSSTPASPVPSASPSDRPDVLLTRGRPVTASSVEDGLTPASAAVDGSLSTRWSSSFSDPQWVQVDLGSVASISKVVLAWDTSYAKGYQIQTSGDGQTWSTIYRTDKGGGGTETLAVSGAGRFIRMYGTVRANQWGYSLWEFEAYGSRTATGCDTGGNDALNQHAAASSVEKGVFLPGYAVDGDPRTRWSSDAADPQWISIDLGASLHICQVVLTWESAYAIAYQIQVSDDERQWSTIYNTSTSTGGTQTLSVAGTGRYLRVYATKRATAYGYSLWEIAVHTGTSP